ncbi:MAG: DUF3953 domain-containing protein [Bacillota bacterium]|uniref:DUF3953 domain-containing protein n=1 Tax=Virgibacillus TaxID=84406 RepID=UPI001268905A|nr:MULTISPECIES: DUF3953 domain-containing protein [Bacillaceae]MDY7045984.1 DUF3953 domain-containing protein [Virgibacillus sp. M23]WBX81050.1 DUF3953 domain-containing protein [Virgibacillus salarius]
MKWNYAFREVVIIRVSRRSLQLTIIVLSGYQLLTGDLRFMPLTILLLGLLFIVMGINEVRKDKLNIWGYVSFITAAFLFFVTLQLLLNVNTLNK